ncbi:hypothetical protein FRX31_014334 [Thalictrum thalictroides]|uniref:Uncharacterized protein n=1 Tax=Thalictrum thalictroides TaxID=46969 RepID=A0A7J6WF85_THATH|nr:hypothetical protein FRX31_014334 [Thalictrum thalictroides]
MAGLHLDIAIAGPAILLVRSLPKSGLPAIPERYVKPPSERPKLELIIDNSQVNIPIIDLSGLEGDDDQFYRSHSRYRRQIHYHFFSSQLSSAYLQTICIKFSTIMKKPNSNIYIKSYT